ncbi:MAG: hypothetical protein ONB48_02305 [candidate division KSB1 bacterium]|nr:hypothetical protein [candidate division KSB1 bacterium]MDZ7272491.1 hypothetical protein [candidate division KSB1 bacterium]MDZ7284485.1 hypothetical protein [candidate division KSB1 bacterium]MDZ7297119.1 hypothetical protein [candidate division KSB1 bacterium]MDZ7306567.1 hypothetical protein [candidate division KSB1 bacterium]
MGNQQLFPLILAAVIVGVALVRGMELYHEEIALHDQQEIQKTLIAAALRAQSWYRTPTAMGGGGRSFASITWAKINFNSNTSIAVLSMSHKRRDSVRLTAVSIENPALRISYTVYPDSLVLMP